MTTDQQHRPLTLAELAEAKDAIQQWFDYRALGSVEFAAKYPTIDEDCVAYWRASSTPNLADPAFPAPSWPHEDLYLNERMKAALVTLRYLRDDAPGTLYPTFEHGQWQCPNGHTQLQEVEFTPWLRRINTDDQKPELLSFEDDGRAGEGADEQHIECRECYIVMSYPADVEVDYQ